MKFWKAGDFSKHTDTLFLTSHNRVRNRLSHTFHRNDFTTFIIIPKELRSRIQYERKTGIYRTDITYAELMKLNYLIVIKH